MSKLVESPGWWRRKMRGLALRVLYWVENSGSGHMDRNGEGLFLSRLLAVLRTRGTTLTLFDVGANVGQYTDVLLQRIERSGLDAEVHAFEPTRAAFDRLRESCGRAPHVILNHAAASDADGTETIYYDAESSTLASLYRRNLLQYSLELNHSETIRTVRLDSYIRGRGIESIHLMKLDVEGHELRVLDGLGSYLRADFIEAIQFEYGGANVDSRTFLRDFYELLEVRGYRLGKVMRNGKIELRPYRAWMENFTNTNYMAISERLLDQLR